MRSISDIAFSDDVFNEVLRVFRVYQREAERCRDNRAFLAGCAMIGAALESMLLAFAACYFDEAEAAQAAPRRRGAVKLLID